MVLKAPLVNANFNLGVSGVAGILGGEEWIAANSSKHLMRHRRWLGWYNSPGSYYVAKKYGTLARSRLFDGLFPGLSVDPAMMLEFDSMEGPRYMGVHSGTRLVRTGHLAYLIARYCEQIYSPDNGRGYESGLFSVTIVDLGTFVEWHGYPNVPEESLLPFDPYSILVSLATVVGGVLSALWGDWYSFAMIFLGAISNGVSSYVFGSGILTLRFPNPSQNSLSSEEGILISQRNIIVLKGSENSVSNITRGKYDVVYAGAPTYREIGLSSIILTLQFLLQLFLVPQGQLIGQIMFLGTFIISWSFNAYLASLDRETLQTKVLFKTLGMGPGPKCKKLYFQTWFKAATFVAFYMHPDALKELLPNDTNAWMVWKDLVSTAWSENHDPAYMPETRRYIKKFDSLDAEGQRLVRDFIKIASEAYKRAKSLKTDDEAKNLS